MSKATYAFTVTRLIEEKYSVEVQMSEPPTQGDLLALANTANDPYSVRVVHQAISPPSKRSATSTAEPTRKPRPKKQRAVADREVDISR